ncbi:MAG: PQQ-binding-like beta-propeller repeat protein [Gemmatimonadota bacterium]
MNFRPPPADIPAAAAGDAPTESWSVDGGRGATPPMLVQGDRAYLAGADRQVRAIDIETGREVWHRRLAGTILGGVLLRDSTLYVATSRPEGKIHALDLFTGRSRWRKSAGDIATPLAVAGGAIAGINRRGELVAFELASGTLRWRRRIGISRLAPLATADGFLVAVGDSVLQVGVTEGRRIAQARLPSGIIGWQQAGDKLLVATADSALVALDPGSLDAEWRVHLDGPILGPAGVRGDTVWAVTRRGTLFEITPGQPSVARRIAGLEAPITTGVAPIADLLVVGGADGVLRGLTREGHTAWRVSLSWNITVDPVPVPGGFLAAGGDGDLHRFSE